jgi:hypothetical protein
MHRGIALLTATLTVAAFGITGSASAATLYTNAAHTTPVAVGTTLTAATPAGTYYTINYSSGGFVDACQSSYQLQVAQNSGGVFKANVGIRTLNCLASRFTAYSNIGSLQVSGSSTTVGSAKVWAATTLTGQLAGGFGSQYPENFSGAGVSAQQPTAGGTPVSIVLNNASSINGPNLAGGKATATFNVAGSYSLG